MKTYTVVFLIGAISALLLTPLVIRLSHACGLVDRPGSRKVHKAPIPRIGGIAIALPFFLATLPVLQLDNDVSREFRAMILAVSVFLMASAVIFVMGYLDDAYGLRARTKLLVQLVCASSVYAAGVRIEHFSVFNWGLLDLGWLSYPLTVLWIVGVTNAVNLLDGLDGLAAGTTVISCGLLAFFAVMQGDQVMAVVALALAGTLGGFLFFNFNPAKIFMGDSGSQFIGFTVATAAALTANKAQTVVAVMLPILALGVPIFDTLLSLLRRFLGRRSLMGPDRGHIHHRLLDRGLSHKKVVLVLYATNAAVALAGVAISIQRDRRTMLVFAAGLLLLLVVFRVSGVFRVRDSVRKLKENRAAASVTREHARRYEEALLRLQEAREFPLWWRALCRSAEDLGLVTLRLVSSAPGGREARAFCSWQARSDLLGTGRPMRASIPIFGERHRYPATLEVALAREGALEEPATRLAFLARLLDESPPPYPKAAPAPRTRPLEQDPPGAYSSLPYPVETDSRPFRADLGIRRGGSLKEEP